MSERREKKGMVVKMNKYLDGYDYPAIHERAGEIMNNRKRLKRSAIDRYMKYFNEKCATSKNRVPLAKEVIPGGIQHNLANNHPFALSITKAEGPYLWDEDGNRYIDLLMAGGPTILGNNYPLVRDSVCEFIKENGPLTGLYSEKEREMAELICKYYPSCDMFRMLGSGTEADIIGIRLARAFTGKKHIIRIQSGYHGWSDQLIYNSDQIDDGMMMLNGIPVECFQHTHAIPPNDANALEETIISLHDKGGVAAFLMEAVGQDSGALPTTREFHKRASEICKKYDVLLIYDEVVTGFRLGMGGAQAVMGTKPDITIFGKIIGGCYPAAGGVGGRRDIMSQLAAGLGQPGNKVRVGGTLSANPMTCVAGIATIKELERLNAHEKMDKAATEFIHAIADLTEKYDIPALVFNQQSILHIDPSAVQHVPQFYKPSDPDYGKQLKEAYQVMLEFAMALAAEGVIIAGGGKTYIGYESIPVLDDALAAYERVFKEFE